MLAQQAEQTEEPSLILHDRLPLALMQITHFILISRSLSAKCPPYPGLLLLSKHSRFFRVYPVI